MTAEDQLHSDICDLIAGIAEGLTAGEVASAICSLVREKIWPDAPAGDALSGVRVALNKWAQEMIAARFAPPHDREWERWMWLRDALEAAAWGEGAAEEREACAKLCDELEATARNARDRAAAAMAGRCAERIRARLASSGTEAT